MDIEVASAGLLLVVLLVSLPAAVRAFRIARFHRRFGSAACRFINAADGQGRTRAVNRAELHAIAVRRRGDADVKALLPRGQPAGATFFPGQSTGAIERYFNELERDLEAQERPMREHSSSGFTLIELAVAIFIITLLAGSILVPLVTQVEARQVRDTEAMLAEAREALLGFAAVNGYLPCPDKTTAVGAGVAPNLPNDGQEDFTVGGACLTNVGNLPGATLGLEAQADPWGNRLRYSVVPAYAQRSPPVIALNTPSNVRVCSTSVCTTAPTNANVLTDWNTVPPTPLTTVPGPNEAIAVVLSHGKNGFGAISYITGTANAAPTTADELANLGAGVFVSGPPRGLGSTAGEFDDIVIWIGRPALFKTMVAAGRLP